MRAGKVLETQRIFSMGRGSQSNGEICCVPSLSEHV
jgi:hypothetical protein